MELKRKKPKWWQVKNDLKALELPAESIKHIKKGCKENKTVRF